MPEDHENDVAGRTTRPDRRYRRRSEELEFDRVAFFSDAVFAIAMTLLVVGIGIPHVSDAKLGEALSGKDAEIFSFFLSFVVIGFYWLAHHRFFTRLAAVDVRFMQINMLYLAAIAFMPFPTALVGTYGPKPVTVVLYAITLGTASFLDAALFWHSQRAGLFRTRLQRRGVPGRGHRVGRAGPRVRDLDPDRVRRARLGARRVAADLPARVADRPDLRSRRRGRLLKEGTGLSGLSTLSTWSHRRDGVRSATCVAEQPLGELWP